MKEKIIGYFLLAFSLTVIVLSAVNVYLVFTNQMEPVNFFSSLGSINLIPGMKAELPEQGGEGVSKSLNVFAHLALMGFISSAGFKIGRLGVMMIRPIKVS